MSTAALMAVPYALFGESWPSLVPGSAWLSIAYSILIATALAYLLQTWAQKYTDAASASVLLCTESLFANLFGWILLHEQKTAIMLAGGLLIFLSILLTEGVFKKKPEMSVEENV